MAIEKDVICRCDKCGECVHLGDVSEWAVAMALETMGWSSQSLLLGPSLIICDKCKETL